MIGEARREAFEQAATRYVEFYRAHMALEEREILSLAERMLTPADWAELDGAFAANRDPLNGHEPEADYRALFTRIVNLVRASIGRGSAFPVEIDRDELRMRGGCNAAEEFTNEHQLTLSRRGA